ncbi:uncharacterized protein LOC143876526 [Tasmannia lanceolata]|uniref:uncharacterized protein LOC143876526 n=1 Tax=Tasmannia lanceolata TaxID=3420 RepID=UPI004062D77C
MASVIDLLLFHHMEINLFNRFVGDMGIDGVLAKQIIALWLWLESIGHNDLIRHIYAHADKVLASTVIGEAQACLECLKPDAIQPIDLNDIPVMAGLIKEPINLRFFHYNRDVAISGITKVMRSICNIIFDNNMMRIAARDQNHPANQLVMSAGFIMRPFGEGTSAQGGGATGSGFVLPEGPPPMANGGGRRDGSGVLSALWPLISGPSNVPAVKSTLNPSARPWFPGLQFTSDDERSMFLTFSRGYPLRREDIIEFFTSNWGNCVENVMVERTPPGVHPMFGRLILNSVSVIPLILNGQQRAKFVIKGRHLWARMFMPRH